MPITVRKVAAAVGTGTRNIAPTLLIGLGGTGKEVLLRTRRRFFERFGTVGFPMMSYLWIDTDLRNLDLDGEAYDFLMKEVAFRPEERFNAEVSGDNFVSYFRDRENHPHIFSWLDPTLEAYGQVVNGAGQKRPFGRLAFFHHHLKIQQVLLKMKNDVLAPEAAEGLRTLFRRHDLDPPSIDRNRLDVVLVFSLAGGTGSGMFLDTAFYCRDLFAGHEVNLTGFAVLPSVFNSDIATPTGQKIYANGYAALKELEHFSLAKDLLARRDDASSGLQAKESDHRFAVSWSRNEPRSLPGPPFNTCYLLDNQSVGSREVLQPRHKRDLCDMVAEAIFLEFNEGNFAAAKRSARSNLEQFLLSKVDFAYEEQDPGSEGRRVLFTDTFSCRFSSFGLTKLYVPADRIRRGLAYRLALDVVDSWTRENPAPADVAEQVRKRYLGPMGLEQASLLRGLARAADNVDAPMSDDARQLVDRDAQAWLEAVPEVTSASVRGFFERLRREASQESDPRARPGDYIARVDANRRRMTQQLLGRFDPVNDDPWVIVSERAKGDGLAVGSIGSVVRSWLDDPRFRTTLAVTYLETASAHLQNEVLPGWRRLAEARRGRAASLEDSISRRLAMLRDEEDEGRPLVRSKKALLRRLRSDLADWIAALIDQRIYQAGVAFANEDLLPYLERLRKFLASLQADLREVRGHLAERAAAFEAGGGHQIFEEVIDEAIIEDSYRLKSPEGYVKPNAPILEQVAAKWVEDLRLKGVADIPYLIALRTLPELTEHLEELALAQFRDLPVRFDVLDNFRRKRGVGLDAALRSWTWKGTPWLPPGQVVSRHKELSESSMDVVFVGTPSAGADEQVNGSVFRTISEALKESAAPKSEIQRLVSHGPDSIYVYTELAGVSIPYVSRIDRYLADAYHAVGRKEGVHIDFREERFPQEVVLREWSEVKGHVAAYRLLLLGTITGVLQTRLTTVGRLTWSFMDFERRPPQPSELGPESFALNTLQKEARLANRLEAMLSQEIRSLDRERRLRLYAVLLTNNSPAGSFPVRWQQRGTALVEINSPGHHILDVQAQALERELMDADSDQEAVRREGEALMKVAGEFSSEVAWMEPRLRVLAPQVEERVGGRKVGALNH